MESEGAGSGNCWGLNRVMSTRSPSGLQSGVNQSQAPPHPQSLGEGPSLQVLAGASIKFAAVSFLRQALYKEKDHLRNTALSC